VKAYYFQEQLINVLASMIESELTFFEMQVECGFMEIAELCQSHFLDSPEIFYTVYMVRAIGKFVLSVFDSIMLFVPEINQTIIGFESIGIDNRFFINFFPDDG
jgi:hypothetical protein